MAARTSSDKLNLSLDMRWIIVALVLVIVVMLALWRPWSQPAADGRTIQVTGEAKLTAEPDEFVFYPSYQFKNADRDAGLSELSKKSDEIVAKLKSLGVTDRGIKTSADGNRYPMYFDDTSSKDTTYTLQLTITVGGRELAQKVQDYLVSTSPLGTVSPQPTFSDSKRKQLEAQARDQATKEARAKADQSARNLGFKVGKVKSVTDGAGFGGVVPLAVSGAAEKATDSTARLNVQPGENDLNYTVSVTYYLR